MILLLKSKYPSLLLIPPSPLNGNPLRQQPDREDLHLGAGSDKKARRPVCRDTPQEIATNA